jgi:hypothetical protein
MGKKVPSADCQNMFIELAVLAVTRRSRGVCKFDVIVIICDGVSHFIGFAPVGLINNTTQLMLISNGIRPIILRRRYQVNYNINVTDPIVYIDLFITLLVEINIWNN